MKKTKKAAVLRIATLAAAMSTVGVAQTVLAEEAAGPSWNISGWVNESMSYYDDGEGSDMVQMSDNGTTLGSRVTFSGSTKLNGGLDAGFDVTIEPFSGNPNFTGNGNQITPLVFSNQDNIDNFNGGDIGLLGSSVYLGGSWGKVTIGLQSMPTDNIGVLGDPSMTIWSGVGALFRGSGFFIRGLNGAALGGAVNWGSFAQCMTTNGLGIGIDCNGVYRNGIRYDLPAFGPVSIAVGYANDDIYDIAAKYAEKIGDVEVRFHLGYAYNANGAANVAERTISTSSVDTGMTAGGDPVMADVTSVALGDTDSEMFTMQLGMMDTVTGLFGSFTWQHEEAGGDVSDYAEDENDAYYTKLGIRKPFTKLGDTAFYVEYGLYKDQYSAAMGEAGIDGTELTRTGMALEQYFGSKMIIYGKYEQLDIDVDGTPAAENVYDDVDELDLFSLGVTYFF
jgi:hypothetical protein